MTFRMSHEKGTILDSAILTKIFGNDQSWQGPCTVILDAEASVQTLGADSIGASATKSYAPRLVSGRILADSVCFLADQKALLAVQLQKTRHPTGEEVIRPTLTIMDPARVVAVEFFHTAPLTNLEVRQPHLRHRSHPGS